MSLETLCDYQLLSSAQGRKRKNFVHQLCRPINQRDRYTNISKKWFEELHLKRGNFANEIFSDDIAAGNRSFVIATAAETTGQC